MKKWMKGILIAGVILALSLTWAFAAGPGRGQGAGDRDRLRDGSGCETCYYVDADGDGLCDNCGKANGACRTDGCGRYFADADGDGLCDNRGT